MKISEVRIHNYRSILDMTLTGHDYMLLVGANNAGKSTVINALRAFYDDLKWSADDFPKVGTLDGETWIEITFSLSDDEWDGLAETYKEGTAEKLLTVRRYLKSEDGRVKASQSNLYGVVNGAVEDGLFYGARQISLAKVGRILYIPALTTTAEQTKMSGPSPLRNMLNFLLKKIVSKSEAYAKVSVAFEELNAEARGEGGFLHQISAPFNQAIKPWDIRLDLSVNTVAPEDITKNLVSFGFIDDALGNFSLDLERFGHGFQRTVIYELIKLAPTFVEEKAVTKKEFNPDFTLILFEEPEAFLHPAQQEAMAYHLRRLAQETGLQVMLTTHSPLFAGKAVENFCQLIRVHKVAGVSVARQPDAATIATMFTQGGMLLQAMTAFVNDPNVPAAQKQRARQMIANPPAADIAAAEEQFRYQLWLDGERAALFFADKVLLVEGATERALFSYLLAGDWQDLAAERICIVDVLGKFNFHRYAALLDAYGIAYGVMLDDDDDQDHHQAVNELVIHCAAKALANPIKFAKCLETYLGIAAGHRPDKKPLEILKAVSSGGIAADKLTGLKTQFKAALAIQ
jgi:putative ATP-dependent endonuclease of OLD family